MLLTTGLKTTDRPGRQSASQPAMRPQLRDAPSTCQLTAYKQKNVCQIRITCLGDWNLGGGQMNNFFQVCLPEIILTTRSYLCMSYDTLPPWPYHQPKRFKCQWTLIMHNTNTWLFFPFSFLVRKETCQYNRYEPDKNSIKVRSSRKNKHKKKHAKQRYRNRYFGKPWLCSKC